MAAEGDVDRLVRQEFFRDVHSGVVVEIGAADPQYLSIGAHFRQAGWRVIGIEPNPVFAALHRERNHEIYEVACGQFDVNETEFTVVEAEPHQPYLYMGEKVTAESFSSLGLRGPYDELFQRVKGTFSARTIKVQVKKLDTLLGEIGLDHIDLICIDVEGWELECLKGFSFGRLSPKVAIIENLFDDKALPDYMAEKGYSLWKTLPPNDIYVLT